MCPGIILLEPVKAHMHQWRHTCTFWFVWSSSWSTNLLLNFTTTDSRLVYETVFFYLLHYTGLIYLVFLVCAFNIFNRCSLVSFCLPDFKENPFPFDLDRSSRIQYFCVVSYYCIALNCTSNIILMLQFPFEVVITSLIFFKSFRKNSDKYKSLLCQPSYLEIIK